MAEINIETPIITIMQDEQILGSALHPTLPIIVIGSGDSHNNTTKLFRFNLDQRSATCFATLEGRTDTEVVYSVAFHPSLSILATGNSDNTAKLWHFNPDGSAASCVATLEGHTSMVYSVAFHPTLPILATGSDDHTAKLWRLNSDGTAASCVATLRGHRDFVSSVAFHPTLNILVTGSGDMTVKLWLFNSDGTLASCVATLQGHRDYLLSVAFHPILHILATGSEDGTVKLWRLKFDDRDVKKEATCVSTLEGHDDRVECVAFHPILPILATCGNEYCTAKLWQFNPDGSAASCIATLRGHTNRVISVAFHASLPILATGSYDDTVKLWLLNSEGIAVDAREIAGGSFLQQYKHPQTAGSLQNESRFFKLVSVNGKEVDGGRYELPSKTKSGKAQTRGPKDKASFAFSEICKKNNKKGECSYKFAIQETTRGSNKKVYHYEGKRVKLTKPIVLELKDKKTGKVKKVVKKYKNIIVAIH
jgi:WD40 repeat protein